MVRHCCGSSYGCVCVTGIMLLLVWTTVVQSCGYFMVFTFFYSLSTDGDTTSDILRKMLVIVSTAQCISYLLYPLFGLITEIYWSRHKVMVTGTVLVFIGLLIATPSLATASFDNCTNLKWYNMHSCDIQLTPYGISFSIVSVVVYQVGLGLFEANAIQFGVDQLQFASNDQVSIFVNWYFWHSYIGKLINIFVFFCFCFMHSGLLQKIMFITPAVCIFMLLITFVIHWYASKPHQYFTSEPISHVNPIKDIYSVLKFVLKHKQPLSRSALTYGEIPSRFDYAKQRYGGPFTTEQVEDVKTFSRLSLILLTLFGSLLQSDTNGFDARFFMQYIVVIVWIPLHMLIIGPCFCQNLNRISILPKIHLGLLFAVGYNLLTLISNFGFLSQFGFAASLLYGCSFVLVYLSALEFILAQAPRNMQGLLIGLWYAYYALSIAFFCVTSYIPGYKNKQLVYKFSTILAILSLLSFQCVSKWYKYRERNEHADINTQNIIEQYTERQLITEQIERYNNISDTFSVTIHSIQ